MTAQPHAHWMTWLKPVTATPAFQNLIKRLAAESDPVYPPQEDRYTALTLAPEAVKVVILGQDPYHGPGQAHGLSFSVRSGVALPPSLRNIFREVEAEGYTPAKGRDGNLHEWHEQGVLLLNTALSVRAGQAGSHQGWGWEPFTDAIVKQLSDRRSGLVFLLWGRHARDKAALIDATRHLVLSSAHPSPLSASSGFFGNGHFRKANEWLVAHGQTPIRW